MSLNLRGLRTAGYKVADIQQAKEWYTKVLGVEPYFDMPFYVGFNVAGYELGLQPEDDVPADTGADRANVVAYWGVDNVKVAYDMLIQLGATPHSDPMDVGEEIVVASVLDPWGNALGLICNPHFKLP